MSRSAAASAVDHRVARPARPRSLGRSSTRREGVICVTSRSGRRRARRRSSPRSGSTARWRTPSSSLLPPRSRRRWSVAPIGSAMGEYFLS
jgi:hypothetical protein